MHGWRGKALCDCIIQAADDLLIGMGTMQYGIKISCEQMRRIFLFGRIQYKLRRPIILENGGINYFMLKFFAV